MNTGDVLTEEDAKEIAHWCGHECVHGYPGPPSAMDRFRASHEALRTKLTGAVKALTYLRDYDDASGKLDDDVRNVLDTALVESK